MRSRSLLSAAALIAVIVLSTACGGAAPEPSSPTLGAPAVSNPTVPAATDTPPVVPSPTEPALANPLPQPTSSELVSPVPSATLPVRQIVINSPLPGAEVSSPVQVSGSVTVSPFEATLVGRVYDADGRLVGEAPVMATAEMGQPGPFSGEIPFTVTAGGPGRVELAEFSAKDGSVMVSAAVDVVLVAAPTSGAIEIPAAGAQVVLPLRILARIGDPNQQITAVLRWQDGTELAQTFTTLAGEDSRGLLIDSLNWMNEGGPPPTPTQPATLELRDEAGQVLARQEISVLSLDDPQTQAIDLYFVLGEAVQAAQRRIPKTTMIGTAALEELLWGPLPPNLAGFGTTLPTPQEVLTYSGREPDWGPRVTLRQLTIVDGVATADFSKEMRAYGGGSLRVMLIRQQIEQTLKQFDTVREVVIAVEGETEEVLQP